MDVNLSGPCIFIAMAVWFLPSYDKCVSMTCVFYVVYNVDANHVFGLFLVIVWI